MSWSISFVGRAEKVAEAVELQLASMQDGASKEGYAEAAPHLAALVRQTFNRESPELAPLVRLNASGHGYKKGDEHVNRQAVVSLEILYGQLLV